MFSTNQVPRRSPQFCWIFVLILLLSGPFRLLSQAYFGSVTGLLTDPTGAVLPRQRLS